MSRVSVLTLVLLAGGCASNGQQDIFDDTLPPMEQTYRGHFAGEDAARARAEIREHRLAPVPAAGVRLLPNRLMTTTIYEHPALDESVIVPSYDVRWPAYERAWVLMPGE